MGRVLFLAVFLPGAAAPEQARRALPSPIDAYFEPKWEAAGLDVAPASDDATFLRRVTLDLTGNLPSPDEVRDFLRSRRRTKRDAKIRELIDGPAAAEYFAHLWVQWLMGHEIEFRDAARLELGALTRWLKKAWTKDLPYDRMARELLSSTGSVGETPPVNFRAKHLVRNEPPAALAGMTARLFLGRDIRCAQCHDHPYDEMTQEDFWGYAAFFRPLSFRGRDLREGRIPAPGTRREDLGERFVPPRFLDGRTPGDGEPLGEALARFTLSAPDDAAARALVDRFWKLFFGRTLSPGRRNRGEPDLLSVLARDFVANGWSLKRLVRTIVRSRTYQLSSEGADEDRRRYAAGPLKMMNPVQFLRAYNFALQLDAYYRKLHERNPRQAPFFEDADAFWVGQTMFAKEMIFPKGRDPEEVLASGTDRLALKLMNNRDLQLLMVARFAETKQPGLLRQVMKKTGDPGRRIEELFLLLVSRPPGRDEKARLVSHVKGILNPYHAYADVFWMLFNSAEFVFVG